MIKINFTKLMKTQEGKTLLNIDFQISENSTTAIFGKSGAGKTTTLRVISGLDKPINGYIKVNDNVILDTENNVNLPAHKRNIGFVFQDFALFPNMTVRKNIEYGLSKNQDRSYVDELLEMIEMMNLANVKPGKLSGGQQQRVALARAIARKPELLLLDEPLSSLDYETRLKLQNEIIHLKSEENLTIIMVSHDISEICKLADNVVVVDRGTIQITGKPEKVFKEINLI